MYCNEGGAEVNGQQTASYQDDTIVVTPRAANATVLLASSYFLI